MKKTALALIVSMLVVAGFVNMAKANWMVVPESPIKDPPVIDVLLPRENETYVDTVPINFTVGMPKQWGPNQHKPYGGIEYVNYSVDGEPITLFAGGWGILHATTVYNFSLTGLAEGNHTLKIMSGGSTVYLPPSSYETFNGDYLYYDVNSSKSVSFYVTVSPKTEPFPTILALAASGVSLAVVIAGLLFYFRKRTACRKP